MMIKSYQNHAKFVKLGKNQDFIINFTIISNYFISHCKLVNNISPCTMVNSLRLFQKTS